MRCGFCATPSTRTSSTGSTPTGLPSTSRCATCSRPKWTASGPLSRHALHGCTASWSPSAPRSRWPFSPSSAAITANTVCCQRHYDTLRTRPVCDAAQPPGRGLDRRCRRRRRDQSLNLITGVMSGAADAEEGPAWWDGTVDRAHSGLAGSRGRPAAPGPPDALSPRPVRQRPSSAMPAPLAIPQPGHSGRPATAASSFTSAWSPAAWSAPPSSTRPGPATGGGCPARTAAMRVDRDGGDVLMVARQHRPGAAAGTDHGPQPLRG